MAGLYVSKRFAICLRYAYPEDGIFNLGISDNSIVLWETTLIISDSILRQFDESNQKKVRVVSLSTPEISEITIFKKPIFRVLLP